MIDTIIKLLKILVAILPFVLLCIRNTKVNLPKSDRSRQFAMPVVALVFIIAGMFVVDYVAAWIFGIINSLPGWIASLANFSWMPAFLQTGINWLSEGVNKLINAINLRYWLFYIANFLIITAYLIVKRVALGIIKKAVKPDGTTHEKIASLFYRFFFERRLWCLKEGYAQVRSLLKTFYYGALVISCIIMVISVDMFMNEELKEAFYPVFGIILMGELYFYLDGLTQKEYGNIMGEDDEAYRVVNYSLLRKFLRSLFKDKVLAENTVYNSSLAYGLTTEDIICELEKNEDPKITALATYVKALHKSGFSIDHNYLRSTVDLLEGKSILFNNPFYKDLIPYAFYPMHRALLSHQKVLVVLGRHAVEGNIVQWLEEGIGAVTNIPFMWNIAELQDEYDPKTDIGIVTRSKILDINLHEANDEFLEQVGFVVVIEPSKLITTAQIGLNLLIKRCNPADKKITYCMCDKNCDGLVDAMSHILMTNITEVSATNKHSGTSSYMCWDADGDYLQHRMLPNISRYLGMGTELSFAALKNQVSKTEWYGGDAFPVADIHWIDRQYYFDLTKYAGLPTNQESMNEYFRTSSDMWSAAVSENNYFTVEDESCNMFEILRNFSTRTTNQGFINIISQEYLLKEYMAQNASIFEADPKAIPHIVADHARTHRNVVLKLLLMMSIGPVGTDVIEKEFSLLGIPVFDLPAQLWLEIFKCFSSAGELQELVDLPYEKAVAAVAHKKIARFDVDRTLLTITNQYSIKLGRMQETYRLNNPEFAERCISQLKAASYVAEDEKGEINYLGSELKGHIYQKYLPGQFFTFGGKYYEMQYVTTDNQVLLRRAADHIKGRPSYRQKREYLFSDTYRSDEIGTARDIAGMKVVKEYADFAVRTPGYFRMERYEDFANAVDISFEGKGIPIRQYYNKAVLRIDLPLDESQEANKIRYTVTMLFNEIFRTLFAENHAYICAVTDDRFVEPDDTNPLTYKLKADGCDLADGAIYIIEDSQLDLGLLVAVERNLQRIFEIMYDYLDWHNKTLQDSLNPPPEAPTGVTFTDGDKKPMGFIDRIKKLFGIKPKKEKPSDNPDNPDNPDDKPQKTKKGFVDKVKGIFKKKPKPASDTPETPTDTPETPAEEPETPTDTPDGEPETPAEEPKTPDQEPDPAADDAETPADGDFKPYNKGGENDADGSQDGEPDSETSELIPERRKYFDRNYMQFGGMYEPECIDSSATVRFLDEMGFGKYNPLTKARNEKNVSIAISSAYNPDKRNVRYCDFCGAEIFGVEYETLADGRDRCMLCSRTAIKTGEEFRKIFEDVRRNMESFFGISLSVGVKVEMVNSRTLHKRLGHRFTPTPDQDGRVLGVAIQHRDGSFSLLVENGSPRMASVLTMAHELTHIWQYLNWNRKQIRRTYGKALELEIYEGMAKWVEVQYALLLNEQALAKRTEIMTAYRDDEYGRGFLRYRENYPFSQGTYITRNTPFMFPEMPLAEEYCGEISIVPPTDSGRGLPDDDPTPPDHPSGGTGGGYDDPSLYGPSNRDPNSPSLYARNLLSEEQKQVYDLFLNALKNFTPKITSLPIPMTADGVYRMFEQVLVDHPEIFWFRCNETCYVDTATGNVAEIDLTFRYTKEEADKAYEEILGAISPFIQSVNDTMSDFEVVLRAYETLVDLVDYDTVALDIQDKIPYTERSNKPDPIRTIYGVFVDRKAVCAGYARAMQLLLKVMGIESAFVSSGSHAWNLVKLEGDYYHLDVTWADSSNTKKENHGGYMTDYSFFCVTTKEILALDAHTPSDVLPLPECTATKCNYHHRHGLYFENYDEARIRDIVTNCVAKGQKNITFKFSSMALRDKALSKLHNEGKMIEYLRFASAETGKRMDLKYSCLAPKNRPILNFYTEQL